MGIKRVIIKRGEYGVLMLSEKNIFTAPAYPLEATFDPTGAGDTFAGGFMGYLTSKGKVDFKTQAQALVYATLVASFTIESFSLDTLDKTTKHDIENRKNEFLKMLGKGLIT